MRVEVAVLGCPFLTSLLVSVDVKQYWTIASALVSACPLHVKLTSEDIKQHYLPKTWQYPLEICLTWWRRPPIFYGDKQSSADSECKNFVTVIVNQCLQCVIGTISPIPNLELSFTLKHSHNKGEPWRISFQNWKAKLNKIKKKDFIHYPSEEILWGWKYPVKLKCRGESSLYRAVKNRKPCPIT